jgi:hypothetical protein
MTVKAPAFQFYPGDWRRDASLRACSLEARGLWIELMAIMHDAEPYGHLSVNGVPLTDGQAASMVGIAVPRFRKLLADLEIHGVPGRTPDGVLFSRRMARDHQVRLARAAGGPKSLQHPRVPRPKNEGRSEGYPFNRPSGESFGGSPAVAVASAVPPSLEGGSSTGKVEPTSGIVGRVLQRHQPERAAS